MYILFLFFSWAPVRTAHEGTGLSIRWQTFRGQVWGRRSSASTQVSSAERSRIHIFEVAHRHVSIEPQHPFQWATTSLSNEPPQPYSLSHHIPIHWVPTSVSNEPPHPYLMSHHIPIHWASTSLFNESLHPYLMSPHVLIQWATTSLIIDSLYSISLCIQTKNKGLTVSQKVLEYV